MMSVVPFKVNSSLVLTPKVEDAVTKVLIKFSPAYKLRFVPAVPYAKDYKTCIEEAKQRIGNAPIKQNPGDITEYDTIFIMSPIYWGTYAPEVETALEGLDFSGKKVRIVCTHEGLGLSGMPADVKRKCVGADVDVEGLAIKGSQAKEAKDKVKAWL